LKLKITKNKLIYYLTLFCSVLAGYFAFTDLQISISIVNETSVWANFLERFGEIPGLLVIITAVYIFSANYSPASKLRRIIISSLLFIGITFLVIYLAVVIYNGLHSNNEFLLVYKFEIIIGAICINLFLIILLRKVEVSEAFKKFSRISLLLGLYGILFLVQTIKIFWGRVRFRDLDALYSDFSLWFIPNGVNWNQSFPSGHSAMGWILLPLLILVANKSKIIKFSLLALIISWGVAVGLSRVVIGAHYASDVLIGAFIIIMIFIMLYKGNSTQH
jgi:membrane-associated phospholipid phosphatase